MAGRIIYLEVDDEITSAAARIRGSDSARIAVVLPYGSRVATSRINFRLLARDALTHDKRLSIVTGDPATRALAASAGLPVFASVAEYESAMAGADDEGPRPATTVPVVAATAAAATPDVEAEEPARAASRSRRPRHRRNDSDGTLGLVVPAAAVGATTLAGPPGDTIRAPVHVDPDVPRYPRPAPPPTSPGGGGARGPFAALTDRFGGSDGVRTPWLIGGAILALALLVGAIGIYLLLPSATIAVTPKTERIGPIPTTIVADTTATQPDPARGVVPAEEISIPVAVNDTFSRDRQAGRADQGDRRGPLREPRSDQHQPDRRREHRAHRVGRSIPDERDDHRAASRSWSA